MKKVIVLTTLLLISTWASAVAKTDASQAQHTFVLVHGASGGGWDWKMVDNYLSANGHNVYRPTLTGLGEKYHLASAEVDLTTHINDVVNTIIFEDLDNVVLVGHSYGGMVITGVMDRIPERIKHVTFLDAIVPDDGMSVRDIVPMSAQHKVIDGQIHFAWLDEKAPLPRDVAQPENTFIEAVSYKNPAAKKLDVTYVAFVPPGMSIAERSQDSSWQRAAQRNWTIRTFSGDHVVYRAKPLEFSAFLESTVQDRNSH
ncbi:MAG: alpha/beta fold hydrolase [Thalassotalea sp.]